MATLAREPFTEEPGLGGYECVLDRRWKHMCKGRGREEHGQPVSTASLSTTPTPHRRACKASYSFLSTEHALHTNLAHNPLLPPPGRQIAHFLNLSSHGLHKLRTDARSQLSLRFISIPYLLWEKDSWQHTANEEAWSADLSGANMGN